MPISYSEQSQLTCPNCGADFEATIWLLLDAGEEPQATEELRAGRLNTVTCPHCGNSGPAGAPLLFHDAATRQVIFAAAPGSAEHELREQARELHSLLVGSIPEEQRRAYLADVQIAQDVEGIAHLLRKHARRFADRRPETADRRPETGNSSSQSAVSSSQPAKQEAKPDESPVAHPQSQPAAESPLLEAVQALLAVDSPA
ncbi:MAG: CpXC domain-containing protein, partial [Chloroflexaceae bacterium]|nr:CpXC domain-containing protein [Chloroflexaceae bacterium]